MELERTTCCYHSKQYGIVEVTPDKEETDWTLDGLPLPLRFASFELWNDMRTDDDEPKDPEAEMLDKTMFYYDSEVDLYWDGLRSDEAFRDFVMNVI